MVRFIEATDFGSWADVAALEIPLYAKAARVPAQGPLRNEVERIREGSSDPVARAEAALRLVQSRVRYVALAMGEGGLVPTDAETTWSRRYGDCKAKTALLLAILGELGIEAEGVVVHTALGDAVAQRVPSVGAFDHILVRARIGGRDYWLDGTRTGDTNLARLQVPDFGWGLPIVPGAELVRIVPAPLDEPNSDLAIHMDASKGVRGLVPARIELTLRGDAAIGTNEAFANFVGEARDRALREYWRGRFDFVEPERVALAYDDQALEAQLVLEGPATLPWDGVWYETEETRLGYRADFSREAGPGQDAPFAVSHPFYTRTRQTIVLPPGFGGVTDGSDEIDETVAGVEYRRRGGLTGNTFFVEATERSVASEFAAAAAPAAQKRLRELADDAVYLRIPSTYRPTEGDLAVLLAQEAGNAQEYVNQGVLLMDAGRIDEAGASFLRATELEPGNVWAWANRGVALARSRKLEEADRALDRAAAIDPDNWVIYNGRGVVSEWRRDHEAAIAAYGRALELNPQNGFARNGRAQSRMNAGQLDLALEELAEEIGRNPNTLEAYGVRFFLLMNSGRRDEASAEIEALLVANPDNTRAADMAGRFYNELGMTEKAQALLGGVLPPPSPMALMARAAARAPGDVAGQLADLDEALEVDPNFIPARFARAQTYWRERRHDEALADTAEILAVDPRASETYLLRANIFNSMGRRDETLAQAEAIVAANPGETFAHVAAGKIYDRFGERERALAAMDAALAIKPEAFIYINRSQVRERSDWGGRMADIEEALRLAPDELSALYVKSMLLTEMGDHAAAVEALSVAVEAEPEDFGWLNTRGIALVRAGRPGEAEADFAKARSLALDAMALNNICYPKAVANVALERALEECEESLKLRPDFAPTLDSRGAVLLRLGRLDEAIRDFDRVLEQAPGMINSRYLRAVARSQKGDAAGAQADLGAVRRDNPTLVESMERDGFVVAPVSAAAAAS
jgi:tetratricopeptide (TPR) repeat protein